MSINEMLLTELDQENANTKRVLERVPVDKWDWKPAEKSGTLGWMASHVATLPYFITGVISSSNYEIAGAPRKDVNTPAELVSTFETLAKEARTALSGVTDEQMKETWTLTWNGALIMKSSRYDALRGACLNHAIHHRGQLTMYLRALKVPLPGLYGPSADEQ